MSATSQRYIVVYDCHRDLRGCPVFLTDEWESKRQGVPRFSSLGVDARKYANKEQAEYDSQRYHPGSGYLPGQVVTFSPFTKQDPPALSDFDIERITEAVVQKLMQNWPLQEGEK